MDRFEYFYNNSALTFEGCAQSTENIEFLTNWLKEHKANVNDDIHYHWITGKEMNEHYGLTESNAYPDYLNILVVEPMDINLGAVIMPRFEIGGRWFDDVIDNNLRREGR